MLSIITGMPIWPVTLGGFWLKLYFLSCDGNESMKNVFKTLISSSFSGVKLLKQNLMHVDSLMSVQINYYFFNKIATNIFF